MSEQRRIRTVQPTRDEYLEAAWQVKEQIRRQEGVLAQGRGFFVTQYRRSTVYLVLADDTDQVAAFAIVRPDGYLSILAVSPSHRRQGLGSTLIDCAAADYGQLTCHTRVTNGGAIGFYLARGFLVETRVPSYYRDGTDAYELMRDGDRGRFSRLVDLLE